MHFTSHNWSATKQHLHPQSVAEISRHSVLSGQDSTMWDIVWVSPQGHRSVSVSHHFLLQAPQCPCFVRKRFSRDHCCWGRSKPGCRIVGSHTRWELTAWADFGLHVKYTLSYRVVRQRFGDIALDSFGWATFLVLSLSAKVLCLYST